MVKHSSFCATSTELISLQVVFFSKPNSQPCVFSGIRPLCWGPQASCQITQVGLHSVTKAWVNFNSASNESSSKLQNIRNRPSTRRRMGSPWSLFRGKYFVVLELFTFSAWYIHHAWWLTWLRTNNRGIKGCTDAAHLPSYWQLSQAKRYYVRPLKMMSWYKMVQKTYSEHRSNSLHQWGLFVGQLSGDLKMCKC